MSKQVLFNKEAQEAMLRGLDKAANAVGGTIGPKGRNAYFEAPVGPLNTFEFTNDGVTIANKIELENKEEDAGAFIIRNVTGQQNDDAGDGTTTVAVLTQALIHESLKRPENPMEVRQSLNQVGEKVLKSLAKRSRKLAKEDVEKVALISAEDPKIAKLITEIIEKLGEKAVINVEDSKTFETTYEIVDGFEAQAGFMSPQFINDKKSGKAVFTDVPVFVTEKKISNIIDIQPLFDQFKAKGINQAVIACDDIDDQMLGIFVVNNLGVMTPQGLSQFKCVVIRATGETLDDIAGVTGATKVSDKTGLTFKDFKLEHLGHAKKVISDINKTLFIINGKKARDYADIVEYQVATDGNMIIHERNRLRLARLRGGIATLKIAAPTDGERIYLRRKAEDAVKATQAALEEGVVEGGGITLWRLAQELKGNSIGEQILKVTMTAPFKKILENAGKDYTDIVSNMPQDQGYDCKADEYVDMFKKGILDPAKVERCALENAISTSGIFITSFALITEIEEKK